MRLEYAFSLNDVLVPRFAVEAVEGIGKVFSLATLIMNTLDTKDRVEIVFHGLNPEDPSRKIEAFRQVLDSCSAGAKIGSELGQAGRIEGSSSYFQWVALTRPS